MNTQPNMFPQYHPPSIDQNADIIPFQPRTAEAIPPATFDTEACVTFFLHRWSDSPPTKGALAELINSDTNRADDTDQKQEYLHKTVDNSPVFDHYDELIEVDRVARLLDERLQASLPRVGDEGISAERKAALTLLYLRGSQVIHDATMPVSEQIAQLPIGDEDQWDALIDRLIPQK